MKKNWHAYASTTISPAHLYYCGCSSTKPLFVISGSNPYGLLMPSFFNWTFHWLLFLVLLLVARTRPLPFIGKSFDGQWEENCWGVLSAKKKAILFVARFFLQEAIFEIDGEKQKLIAANGTIKAVTILAEEW